METRVNRLHDFFRMIKKAKKKEKYNDRMKKRLQKVNGSGKAQKNHSKEPQSRKPSTKVNKGEEFTRLSKYARRLLRRGY